MSRNAHEKSGIKPRKLPRCSKCNTEFILVTSSYAQDGEERGKIVDEWECPKCHKVVPRDTIQEEEPGVWESFLHERAKEIHKDEERRKRSSNQGSFRLR